MTPHEIECGHVHASSPTRAATTPLDTGGYHTDDFTTHNDRHLLFFPVLSGGGIAPSSITYHLLTITIIDVVMFTITNNIPPRRLIFKQGLLLITTTTNSFS